jgi:FlaA1/EpsC-like NDP-sugar epimerase
MDGFHPMKVYITGVTGTLGRAFVDHLRYGYAISGVDHNEDRVAALKRTDPHINVKIGDFADADLSDVDVLIHLAAFKHIDLCETSPTACISNNVVKTFNLFQNAHRNGVDILFVSTDKAVEPRSTYGLSKALMERMAVELGGAFVRSGNIMASNGSVTTVWERAVQEGRPLTITHRDMRRFFITPEHFVSRVWKAYLSGERVIIPAMDDDITLLELADRTLRKFGKSIDTYPIEYSGLRPGEKLQEKLQWDDEVTGK